MKKLEIEAKLCKACGLCAEVCPNKVFRKEGGHTTVRAERIHLCFACGQCMAICPTKAVAVEGYSYEESFYELPERGSYEEPFFNLIRTRRAVRNFSDKPVPRALLEKVADAISLAPPGFPPVKTEITIVQNPESSGKRSLLWSPAMIFSTKECIIR